MANDRLGRAWRDRGELQFSHDFTRSVLYYVQYAVCFVVGLAGLVYGLVLLWNGVGTPFTCGSCALYTVLGGLVGLFVLGGAWNTFFTRRVVKVYEGGVYCRTLFVEKYIPFEEVSSFTRNVRSKYVVWTDQGNRKEHTETLVNYEVLGEDGRSIDITAELTTPDIGEFEPLGQLIGQGVRDEWLRRLADGDWIEWCSGLTLFPDGLEYRDPNGRDRDPLFVGYETRIGLSCDNGVCTVTLERRTRNSKAISVSCADVNFLCGFYLLDLIQRAGGVDAALAAVDAGAVPRTTSRPPKRRRKK